jgi:hypothetical protein
MTANFDWYLGGTSISRGGGRDGWGDIGPRGGWGGDIGPRGGWGCKWEGFGGVGYVINLDITVQDEGVVTNDSSIQQK